MEAGTETQQERATRLILGTLLRHGGTATRQEIHASGVASGEFSPEELELVESGRRPVYQNQLGWQLTRLREDGLIRRDESELGRWHLTEEGQGRAENLTPARTEARRRNPPWTQDELILALDLYLRHGLLDDLDPQVQELSDILNALPLGRDRRGDERYRNPNGVAMKLGNFARLDPDYAGAGLSRGGRREVEVWNRYADDRDELHSIAERLRAIAAGEEPGDEIPAEDDDEASEGRILFRKHRVRERDRGLVKRKKRAVLDATGALRCEVCGLDPAERYGEIGSAAIECHHLVPLSEAGTRTTRLSDLIVVCRNCHAAIHAGGVTRQPREVQQALREPL